MNTIANTPHLSYSTNLLTTDQSEIAQEALHALARTFTHSSNPSSATSEIDVIVTTTQSVAFSRDMVPVPEESELSQITQDSPRELVSTASKLPSALKNKTAIMQHLNPRKGMKIKYKSDERDQRYKPSLSNSFG